MKTSHSLVHSFHFHCSYLVYFASVWYLVVSFIALTRWTPFDAFDRSWCLHLPGSPTNYAICSAGPLSWLDLVCWLLSLLSPQCIWLWLSVERMLGLLIPGRLHGRWVPEMRFCVSFLVTTAATAKSLQSCPTLCDPIAGSPPGCPVPGILQARTLEWAAISFSNAWKWKVKAKSLSHVRLLATPWTAAHQASLSMGFSRQEYWSGVPLPSPWLPQEYVFWLCASL